jgi:hypothetical protein
MKLIIINTSPFVYYFMPSIYYHKNQQFTLAKKNDLRIYVLKINNRSSLSILNDFRLWYVTLYKYAFWGNFGQNKLKSVFRLIGQTM